MQEINCPHCGKAFKIDESGYADILKQVRDSEFDQALHDRLALAEKDKQSAVDLAMAKASRSFWTWLKASFTASCRVISPASSLACNS